MTTTLTQAAQALLDSIETDEGGQVGKSGNGGLLSRKTLILAGQLRAELLRTTPKQAFSPIKPDTVIPPDSAWQPEEDKSNG